MNFVLILTLVIGGGSRGVSVAHVPGFVNLPACQSAAAAWLADAAKAAQTAVDPRLSAACARVY